MRERCSLGQGGEVRRSRLVVVEYTDTGRFRTKRERECSVDPNSISHDEKLNEEGCCILGYTERVKPDAIVPVSFTSKS